MQVPLIRLQCGANSYEWGKKGHDSAVARFAAATPSDDFAIQHDRPYAEASSNAPSLWRGVRGLPCWCCVYADEAALA